jgi:hypothetical protein
MKQNPQSLRCFNAYLISDYGDISNREFHCTSWRKVKILDVDSDGSGNGYSIFSSTAKYRGLRFSIMIDAKRRDQSINVLFGLRESGYQRVITDNTSKFPKDEINHPRCHFTDNKYNSLNLQVIQLDLELLASKITFGAAHKKGEERERFVND